MERKPLATTLHAALPADKWQQGDEEEASEERQLGHGQAGTELTFRQVGHCLAVCRNHGEEHDEQHPYMQPHFEHPPGARELVEIRPRVWRSHAVPVC